MKRKQALISFIVASAIATAAGVTYANQETAVNDAIADLSLAKVSLVQAVGVAEARYNGRAVKGELDNDNGRPLYQVEVATPDNRVFDVSVDAVSGQVISGSLDRKDREREDND